MFEIPLTPGTFKAALKLIILAAAVHSFVREKLPLGAVMLSTTSGRIGQTLKPTRFAARFDAVVLALRRRDTLRERPSTTPLRAGDVLVVEGEAGALKHWPRRRDRWRSASRRDR